MKKLLEKLNRYKFGVLYPMYLIMEIICKLCRGELLFFYLGFLTKKKKEQNNFAIFTI